MTVAIYIGACVTEWRLKKFGNIDFGPDKEETATKDERRNEEQD
jgi:hypothetical protein